MGPIPCLWTAACTACGTNKPPGEGILRQHHNGTWIAFCADSVACSRRILARIDPALLAVARVPVRQTAEQTIRLPAGANPDRRDQPSPATGSVQRSGRYPSAPWRRRLGQHLQR